MTPPTHFRTYCFAIGISLFLIGCSDPSPKDAMEHIICEQIDSKPLELSFQFAQKQDSIPIRATHSGILESFSIKSNAIIRKGIVVAHIENRDAYLNLRDQKSRLKSDLAKLEFPKILEPTETTWREYGESIQLEALLPEVPKFSFREEMNFLKEKGIIAEINSIILSEIRMLPYFTKAPTGGKFIQIKNPGTEIKKGDVIGVIVKKSGIEIQPEENSLRYVSADFQFELDNKTIISYDTNKHSFVLKQNERNLSGTYSLQSIQALVRIPNSAIKNGTIGVLENGIISRKKITPLIRTAEHTYIASSEKSICLVH